MSVLMRLPLGSSRMAKAQGVAAFDALCLRLIARALDGVPVRVVLWSGASADASTKAPIATVHIRDRSTLVHLALDPDVGFGEGYRCGCIEVEGDLVGLLAAVVRKQVEAGQPFRGFRTGAIGHPDVTTDFGAVVSYGIRRCEFDQYLLQRSGADVRDATRVGSLERTRDHWIVNGTLCAPVLVGAGGHFCPVAKLLNPSQGYQRPATREQHGSSPQASNGAKRSEVGLVVAQEIEFVMTPAQ